MVDRTHPDLFTCDPTGSWNYAQQFRNSHTHLVDVSPEQITENSIEACSEFVTLSFMICLNPFLHRYTFIVRANSLDPDQLAQIIRLFLTKMQPVQIRAV
jgi:hypothetical protein